MFNPRFSLDKRVFVVCITMFLVAFQAKATDLANTNPKTTAIYDMIERLLPGQRNSFALELKNDSEISEYFELESKENKIVISGNSISALNTGIGWYLKYVCKVSVSWFANAQIQAPEVLPQVPNKIREECSLKHRFFLNYCTYGYTMPWWTWNDWERLIDFMAINGVNLPLNITGQESIWLKVWQEFGLNEEQIRKYFTGPAHLPWHRMANIDGWQGPLPMSYITNQFELQKKILKRERELGMSPILPAFAGHVPLALKKINPQANIKKLGSWARFSDEYRTYFLDPLDPLFKKIQKAFLDEQEKHFGTNHYYGTDPFNEVRPPSLELDYLAQVSKTIYESLAEVDKDAIWIQMAWTFHHRKYWSNPRVKAMMDAVPTGKMIMLDYWVEHVELWRRNEGFFGKPYIWCFLGNFGGNTRIMGRAQHISNLYSAAVKNPNSHNFSGVGSTLEGMGVNRLMHEMVMEFPWHSDTLDSKQWFIDYGIRRCGTDNPKVKAAWKILNEDIYSKQNKTTGPYDSLVNKKTPSIKPKKFFSYNNKKLLEAWQLLANSGEEALKRDSMQYDLVNIGRQVLANHCYAVLAEVNAAYNSHDIKKFDQTSKMFLELLDDVERLLGTRSEFLLGDWLQKAEDFGVNETERLYYQNNARTIISTWGGYLIGYAKREWAGMISSLYKPKWELLFKLRSESLATSKEFNSKKFNTMITDMTWAWTRETEIPASKPIGDSVEITKELIAKYSDQILNGVFHGDIIAKWSANDVTDGYTVVTWQLKSKLKQTNTNTIMFQYTNGKNALEIKNVKLIHNGHAIAKDNHCAWTGIENKKNTYVLKTKDKCPIDLTLSAEIKGAGGNDSNGTIQLLKQET